MYYLRLLLVVFVLLAGCATVGGPAESGEETGMTGLDAVTPTDTEPSTPTPPAFPAGYDEAGVNASIAQPLHEERAVESGSMTLNVQIAIRDESDGNESTSMNINGTYTYRADFRNQTLRTTKDDLTYREGYLPAGEKWLLVYRPSRNTSVSPYSMTPAKNLSWYANPRIGHNDMFAYVDTLDFSLVAANAGRLQYDADTFDDPGGQTRLDGIRTNDFRNVTATLIVDEEGRVHRFTFEGDVFQGVSDPEYAYTYSLMVTASKYGATRPLPPEWLDKARETFDD